MEKYNQAAFCSQVKVSLGNLMLCINFIGQPGMKKSMFTQTKTGKMFENHCVFAEFYYSFIWRPCMENVAETPQNI